jgi:dihydroorotate dehydrogenase
MLGAVDLLYRALYRGVLARMPERAAIAIGQWGLRHVPLDRLGLFRNEDPRLAITLGGVTLPNPLILSSMYYDTAILRRAMGLGWGAVTAKSITLGPCPGHPEPNLVRIETAEGPGLVKINISSPNTKLVYGWSTRPHELKDVFRAVRGATRKPVIVKISPDFRETNEELTIPAALDAGITIVNYGNTRRVEEPRLSQRSGGLSGPALFATTLENVRRVRERFGERLELIATGGIDSPERARQALAAGATACGIFTGFITRGPLLARRILDALQPTGK